MVRLDSGSIELIAEELRKLPKAIIKGRVLNRKGIQNEAAYRIAHAIWLQDDTLRVASEFDIEYVDGDGKTTGQIDLVIYDPTFEKLLGAIEVVTDKVLAKDLYKLRDAPVIEGGLRLLVQLNPAIKYPIDRGLALDDAISDNQAKEILVLLNWRRCYTLLQRRAWALKAQERESKAYQTMRWWLQDA